MQPLVPARRHQEQPVGWPVKSKPMARDTQVEGHFDAGELCSRLYMIQKDRQTVEKKRDVPEHALPAKGHDNAQGYSSEPSKAKASTSSPQSSKVPGISGHNLFSHLRRTRSSRYNLGRCSTTAMAAHAREPDAYPQMAETSSLNAKGDARLVHKLWRTALKSHKGGSNMAEKDGDEARDLSTFQGLPHQQHQHDSVEPEHVRWTKSMLLVGPLTKVMEDCAPDEILDRKTEQEHHHRIGWAPDHVESRWSKGPFSPTIRKTGSIWSLRSLRGGTKEPEDAGPVKKLRRTSTSSALFALFRR